MTDGKGDILVKIPDEQLPKLLDLYEKHANLAPYTMSFVSKIIRRKQSKLHHGTLNIFSPNGCWEKDGAIVVIPTCYSQDIFVFTLDDTCSNLETGLLNTKRIDKKRRLFFSFVYEKFLPTITRYIKGKNITNALSLPNYKYVLPPEEGRKFLIECPPEVYLKKLDKSAVKKIDPLWPRNYPDSEACLSEAIEKNGGWGVFLKADHTLVAWILRHLYGHMVVLQTDEAHMGKGYASLVVKAMAREVGEEGYWSIATVYHINLASNKLFEKLGFRRVEDCSFIEIWSSAT